ncbi:uncharacterized protein [Apostichopus japonicus]|uniref:uncharacterized protein n=1 Tax=Stichopus japonicus TaxID=307972 RepID=UPI003AB37E60
MAANYIQNSTGYGPSRFQRLVFNGNPDDYELWETKFTAYLRTLKLKCVLATEPPTEPVQAVEEYNRKNEEVYAELVQCLDDKSLGLIIREADNDGKKAFGILREHYQGTTKPRIVSLYMQLINIQMAKNESVTSYIIRAEKIIGALERAKEVPGKKLLISILLKGLPARYKQFSIHVTQSNEDITISRFKVALKNFEETECFEVTDSDKEGDAILKMTNQRTCYGCGSTAHVVKDCDEVNKQCKYHKGAKHLEKECNRHKMVKDRVNVTSEKHPGNTDHTFNFSISEGKKGNGLLVDTGATSHALNVDTFVSVDPTFAPGSHCIELVDGTKLYGSAIKRGDAKVSLVNSDCKIVEVILQNALYCPSYPKSIFSVKSATANGVELTFNKDRSWMEKAGWSSTSTSKMGCTIFK